MTSLNDAYVRFCDLLTLAEELFAAENFSAAARLAQIAARYAYPASVGLFSSPRLERLLLELGRQVPSTSPCGAQRRGENSRNVLHVLSYAQPIGGDSRFVWRWMQEDRNSRHSVAITTQADLNGKYVVPEALRQSTGNTGGCLHLLSAPTSKPLEQAHELRLLCQGMDVIALHIYPYDVIPVLALSAGCDSAKTVFINHSDHTFWIGASVAHSIVHLRRQCPDFLRNRRGLYPDRSSILPIPLAYSPPSMTPLQAKRALGYEPDVVVLLTIATPFKYWAPGQVSFLDLVTPVLAKHPKAVLIAVGPDPKGPWRSASTQTDGRIVALGKRWDNEILYSAADVYLDSVPFSSITSLLEAGSRAKPLIGYSPQKPELWVLGPGAPGLDNAMEMASDAESYRTLLSRLISDAEFRHQSGERVQAQILSLHTGSNWTHTVHDMYASVELIKDRGCLLDNKDNFASSVLNLALVQLWGRKSFSLRSLIRQYIGTLAYRSRRSITWRLRLKGIDLCLLNLLPPQADAVIHRIGRWVKGVLRRAQTV